uniref:Uncharacterized protein n=1 Tax=Isometrus maculatus TaxID=497827 RepID=A0A0U1SA90_ISOMC|nr:hypothetical protein [Isometrus maculatus]
MKACLILFVVACAARAQQGPPPPPPGPRGPPAIDWGKCPQLKPSDGEKEQKSKLIQECLKEFPPPTGEVTREEDEQHRDKIADCGLKKEGWLKEDGGYKFDKARKELAEKKLDKEVEETVLKKHDDCQKEAETEFAKDVTRQIPMYQACMDFHISEVCGIRVSARPPPPPPGA